MLGTRCVLKENYRQFRRNTTLLTRPESEAIRYISSRCFLPVSLTIHKTPVKWINIVFLFPSSMESSRASAVAPA